MPASLDLSLESDCWSEEAELWEDDDFDNDLLLYFFF